MFESVLGQKASLKKYHNEKKTFRMQFRQQPLT